MTAQITDIYYYKTRQYNIVAMSDKPDFHPRNLGLDVSCNNTACWRGYWCEYEISEDIIFLEKLFVNTVDGKYPDINGIRVNKKSDEYRGHRAYEGLSMAINYTGKILLGDERILEYGINAGHPSPWEYKILKEFVFEKSKLTKINDYSSIAKDIRETAENELRDVDEFKQFYILDKIAKEKLPIEYNIHRASWG